MSPALLDALSVSLDREGRVPLHRQLADGLREAALRGAVRPGTRLPASRSLAADLGVSRGTVVLAYEHLAAEGVVQTRTGAGTFVEDLTADQTPVASERLPVAERAWTHAVRPLAAGAAAVDAFPRLVLARLTAAAYRDLPTEAFGYGDPAGYLPLREALAAYLGATRGVLCSPHQIVVTTGVQQALGLAARALGPGEAWVEDPGYWGARQAVEDGGLTAVPVPVDAEGLSVEAGRGRAAAARLAVVSPAHQFPLGVTMTLRRRQDLLAWARSTDAYVFEDDYDGEYRYAGRPLATLHALAPERVLYAGTFSKTIGPALRLGYVVVPPELVGTVVGLREAQDRGSATVPQAALAAFIEDGHLGRHVRRTRALCQERQHVLVVAVRDHLCRALHVTPARAGLHLVARLLGEADPASVVQRASKAGVHVALLSSYAAEAEVPAALVLGYAPYPKPAIRSAVGALFSVLG